jgi:hypothetical protein
MKKAALFTAVSLLLCTLSGCGSSGSDGLIQQQIQVMNEMADALENKAGEAKMKELEGRLESIGTKLKEIKLSKEEQEALMNKHKEALMKATQRMMTAALKGGGFPGMDKLGGPNKEPGKPE